MRDHGAVGVSNTPAISRGEVGEASSHIAAANDNRHSGRVPLVHASAPLTAAVVPVGALDKAGKPDLASAGVAGPSHAERGRGKRLPETLASIELRNELLREARRRFFPYCPEREAAREIASALSRFQSSAWIRERCLEVCPERHRGRLGELLWTLLHVRDHVPSFATIRNAISFKKYPIR